MGTGMGMGQGGIMGQFEERMKTGTLPQQHIAGMLFRGFQKASENSPNQDAVRKYLYGGQPAQVVAPPTAPQGIASALPKAPPPSPVVPTQGYRIGPY